MFQGVLLGVAREVWATGVQEGRWELISTRTPVM